MRYSANEGNTQSTDLEKLLVDDYLHPYMPTIKRVMLSICSLLSQSSLSRSIREPGCHHL